MSRRKKLLADVEELVEAVSNLREKYPFIADVVHSDNVLSLNFVPPNGDDPVAYTLLLEEYPSSTTIMSADRMDVKSNNLAEVVIDIQGYECRERGLADPAGGTAAERQDTLDSISSLVRQDTADSVFSIALSDDGLQANEVLERLDSFQRDSALFAAYYPESWVAVERVGYDLDEVDIVFGVPVGDLIDSQTGEGWGIDRRVPVVVRLKFMFPNYVESSTPPKVELSQDSPRTFRLAFQLRNILCGLLTQETWSQLLPASYGIDLAQALEAAEGFGGPRTMGGGTKASSPSSSGPGGAGSPSGKADAEGATAEGGAGEGVSGEGVSGEGVSDGATAGGAQDGGGEVDMERVSGLMDMGFDLDAILVAVAATPDNESAAALLLGDDMVAVSETAAERLAATIAAESEDLVPAQNARSATATTEATTATAGWGSEGSSTTATTASKGKSVDGSGGVAGGAVCDDGIERDPSSKLLLSGTNDNDDGIHPLQLVDPSKGLFVMVADYLRSRMKKLHMHCIMCDQLHLFSAGGMLQPSICSRSLCCYTYQQLGVGAESAADIALGTAVVDLLVVMAKTAATSTRRDLIFAPYPTIVAHDNPDQLILDPEQKDFDEVAAIFAAFPTVQELAEVQDVSQLRSAMDAAHPYAFDLLRWIISSNRSHLVLLPPAQLLPAMTTSYQYLLLSAAPEREAIFRELKAQHGSIFGWHGSATENWHAILRQGLKNASGTSLQMNGAAHGSGVYLSTSLSYSWNYTVKRMGSRVKAGASGSDRFLCEGSTCCIALCEAINSSEIRKSGNIYVFPNETHVVTRFLFVFSNTTDSPSESRSSVDAAFHKEISDLLEYIETNGAA